MDETLICGNKFFSIFEQNTGFVWLERLEEAPNSDKIVSILGPKLKAGTTLITDCATYYSRLKERIPQLSQHIRLNHSMGEWADSSGNTTGHIKKIWQELKSGRTTFLTPSRCNQELTIWMLRKNDDLTEGLV